MLMVNIYILEKTIKKYEKHIPFLSDYRLGKIKDATSTEYIKQQVTSELFLMYVLNSKYGLEIPFDISLTKHGKPYIKDFKHNYNLSHTKNYYVIAVGQDEVGVDAELICRNIAHLNNKILSSNEQEIYENSNNKNNYLIDTWVRKESVLKYIGIGIISNLNEIETSTNITKFLDKQIHLNSFIYNDLSIGLATAKNVKIDVNVIKNKDFIKFINKHK